MLAVIFLLLILPLTVCAAIAYFIARYTFGKLVLASNSRPKAWSIFTFVAITVVLFAVYATLVIFFVPFGR